MIDDVQDSDWMAERERIYTQRREHLLRVCVGGGPAMLRTKRQVNKMLIVDREHKIAYCRQLKVSFENPQVFKITIYAFLSCIHGFKLEFTIVVTRKIKR